MKILLIILLSLSYAHASLPELFGGSAAQVAIGAQANENSAANNFYAPALLAFNKSSSFAFDIFYAQTKFKDINNVTIENDVTTVNSGTKTGDVDVNQTPTAMFGAHLSTPIFNPEGVKFNLSIYAPFDRLLEGNTGDQYRPRYVMYDSRFIRPTILFGLAHQYQDWGFSLGAQSGMQTNGDAYFVTKTPTNENSLGKISYNAKPTLGLIVSAAKKWERQMSYFTFTQEMKSKFKSKAMGETDIGGGGSFPFNFDLDSTMYFDPMTLRLGHQISFEKTKVFATVEFQKWDNYEGSHLKIKKRGGSINGSHNYEKIKSDNIFIPKIGVKHDFTDRWSGSLGYFYRPTPLDVDNLENAGNTIDTDKHVAGIGAGYKVLIQKKIINLDLSYQGHFLKSHKVTKNANQEDGQSGAKIGSPGYDIGGMIHALSFGVSWMY